jgi:dCTP deaminase
VILAESALREALTRGEIVLEPPAPPENIGPGSIDLRLDSRFRLIDRVLSDNRRAGVEAVIDLGSYRFREFAERFSTEVQDHTGAGFLLEPYRLVLASTLEHITLSSGLAARVEGKSSFARVGLAVHITAPTVQPGWRGQLQLELLNVGPASLRLRPGRSICQLIVERVQGEGEYQGQFQASR